MGIEYHCGNNDQYKNSNQLKSFVRKENNF